MNPPTPDGVGKSQRWSEEMKSTPLPGRADSRTDQTSNSDLFKPSAPEKQAPRHPFPGFTVAQMPDYRLLARIYPYPYFAPFDVSPRAAWALQEEGSA